MPIDILTIVFRFTLFGLLAYKVIQLVTTYVIPFLKEEVNLEHKQQTELLEKEKLLISTQHRLENQMSHQKKTFAFLEKNVLMWQAYLLKQKEDNEHAAKIIATNIEEKRKTQQQHLALAKDGAAVIPMVCEQVTHELTTTYEGDYGKQQLRDFIASITLIKKAKI